MGSWGFNSPHSHAGRNPGKRWNSNVPGVFSYVPKHWNLIIAGAVCFALRKPNPVPGWFEFHEVFHLGTVIGYACHVVAIYLIACAL